MDPTTESQPARDELFRRIGRNVVNFQYLEATLRSMIPVLSTKGTLAELEAQAAKTSRKHKKSSLGELSEAYHSRIFGASIEDVSDATPSELTLAFSVRVGSTREDVALQKRALLTLVAERNRLVHSDALSIDLGSREQCEAFAVQLDEQNARIRQQLEQLNSFRTGLREAAEEFQRFIESDEFLATLKGERDEADPFAQAIEQRRDGLAG